MKYKTTRREFVKKNVMGGLIGMTGIPFLSLNHERAFANSAPLISEGPKAYEDINWGEIRQQFPLSRGLSHFNTASLGPSPQVVIDRVSKMMQHLATVSVNGHKRSFRTNKSMARFLNASPQEIAITRNATEGMNIVARGLPLKAGDEVLLTKHEHIGGAAPWMALQKDIGVQIKLVDLDLEGKNNLQIIKDHLTDRTKVVSFSHVTCTTGMRLPAREIVELCRSKGIYSCIDGAQAIGMIPVDLADINPDFYVGSGHKWMFGPKGTGILFINQSVIEQCSPVFVGAYSDSQYDLSSLTLEYKQVASREEYGTRNTPVTMGLGSAVDFIANIGIDNVANRGRKLASQFSKGLSDDPRVEILSPTDPDYATSIVTIRVEDMDNLKIPEKLLKYDKYLQTRGVYENDLNGVRLSFAIFNDEEEVDYLLGKLKEVISK